MLVSLIAVLYILKSHFFSFWNACIRLAGLFGTLLAVFDLQGTAVSIVDRARTTQGKYVHKPLNGPQDIRVLELLPSHDPDAEISCRIHHICLSTPTLRYIAISYAWGCRDVPQAVVNCDGHGPSIPPSLHSD